MQWFLANVYIVDEETKLVGYQIANSNMIGSPCIDAISPLSVLLNLLMDLSVIVEPMDTQRILNCKARWLS